MDALTRRDTEANSSLSKARSRKYKIIDTMNIYDYINIRKCEFIFPGSGLTSPI